jgi:hypothetical protein
MVLARRLLVLLAILTCVSIGLTVPAVADGGHGHSRPVVYPPNSRPYGASYAEWNARWRQWALGTDRLRNPVFAKKAGTPDDPADVNCAAGQSGRVWFLGGTYAPTTSEGSNYQSTVFRRCRIPQNVALFFPVLNSEADNLWCPNNSSFTAAQLVEYVRTNNNYITRGSMAVTIDGMDIDGLQDSSTAYRSRSPWFSYSLPRHNVGTVICGRDFPRGTRPPRVDGHPGAIAEGVYLMVAPLPRGKHTLHVQGKIDIPGDVQLPPDYPATPFTFVQDINYTITVGSGGHGGR